MQFGLYAPIPMATVGSPEVAQAVTEALVAAAGRPARRAVRPRRRAAAGRRRGRLRARAVCRAASRQRPLRLGAGERDRLAAQPHPRAGRRASRALGPGHDRQARGLARPHLPRPHGAQHRQRLVRRGIPHVRRHRAAGRGALSPHGRVHRHPARAVGERDVFLRRASSTRSTTASFCSSRPSPTLPEIYSVSRSDRGRDFIAEHCDWWFVDYPKDRGDDRRRHARHRGRRSPTWTAGRARIGRKVRYALNPFVALGRDRGGGASTRRSSASSPSIRIPTSARSRAACCRRPRSAASDRRTPCFGSSAIRRPRHRAAPLQDDPDGRERAAHRRGDHRADARYTTITRKLTLTTFRRLLCRSVTT